MAKRHLNDSQISTIVSKATKTGAWSMESGSKHPKLRHTSGRMVTIPTSPSDHRSPLNFMKHIRHVEAGLPGWGMGNVIA